MNNDLFSQNQSDQTGNLFFHSTKYLSEQQDSSYLFEHILESFKLLNFEENEIKSILAILASIVHLGRAGADKSQTGSHRGQFQNVNSAQKAAQLLGLSYNQLNEFIFSFLPTNNSSNPNGQNRLKYTSGRISPADGINTTISVSPQECLQGFCIGLYQECLNLIVNCINRSFKQNYQNQAISNSMLIVDPPGFQQNSTNPCSYSDLICNYISERLQLMFFQINFINPIEKCTQEGLDIDLVEHIPESPSSLVNWLDKPPPPNSIRGISSSNTADITNAGLLWLLEEQINNSDTKSANELIQRLVELDTKQSYICSNSNSVFTIYHQFGQFPVEYNLQEWLEFYNKEFSTQRNALTCLQESKKEAISTSFYQSLIMSNAAATLNSNSLASPSLNSLESAGTSTLKRQASVRKMLTLSKRKTFTTNFKLQVDSLFDSMRKTKCNFVFCLMSSRTNGDDLDVPLVRSQLKAYQILATCRIYRQGYPEFLNLEEFIRRFSMFSGEITKDMTHKQACLSLIKSFDLDNSLFKIGNTQVINNLNLTIKNIYSEILDI